MSLAYHENHNRGARIAHEIVKDLTPADVHWLITEGMKLETHHRLYGAVDPEYPAKEKLQDQLRAQISELCGDVQYDGEGIFGKYVDLECAIVATREIASFNLGFMAALRLLGAPPSLGLLRGGNQTPRLWPPVPAASK